MFALTETHKRNFTALAVGAITCIPSIVWDYALIRIIPRILANLPTPVAIALIIAMIPGTLIATIIQVAFPIQLYYAIKNGVID